MKVIGTFKEGLCNSGTFCSTKEVGVGGIKSMGYQSPPEFDHEFTNEH
jgi:hypothetical protein